MFVPVVFTLSDYPFIRREFRCIAWEKCVACEKVDVHRTVSNHITAFPTSCSAPCESGERYVGNVTSKCALEALPRRATLNAAVSFSNCVARVAECRIETRWASMGIAQRDTAGFVEVNQSKARVRKGHFYLLSFSQTASRGGVNRF